MDSGQISFRIFALVGVIMLVLAGASFGYLLQVKNKSRSSWMLLWFFLCIILSSIATILTNTGTIWDWAFAPAQDALIILGGVFLARFAYIYPTDDQPGEARSVTAIFAVLALAALSYAIFFAIKFLSNLSAQINENPAYYLITPLTIILLVFIFLRRSQHCSAQPIYSTRKDVGPGKVFIKTLIRPNNQPALALRNFGLALSAGLIPAVVTVIKGAFPPLVASFLFNFGVVVAIAAIMLVYLNHAPEPTTISAKLVGISLVTILLIIGLASVWFILNTSETQVHATVTAFIYLALFSSLLIIAVYPLFFRSTLLSPLDRLLKGVRIANDGNLDIQVEVQYEDEVGFLTQSFNRMVSSLKNATQALKNESINLEKEVAERTAELLKSNEQLIIENIERRNAETRLDRQLRYQQALGLCSEVLLGRPEDEAQQIEILNAALALLIPAAGVSRAYIFQNLQDPDLGPCLGILAEACAPGILAQLGNPANWKFPWSQLPIAMFNALKAGDPHGGPIERTFASTPSLLENFLHQSKPLLSVQFLPIFFNEQWWGFVGFDDCETAREWDEPEILMLRTASEMIGNTLQRWQAEEHLRKTLEHLEQRVQERTIEFAQANAELRHEIHERQRFQNELEERLKIERTLAKISARLISPMELNAAIRDTMDDLGQIMQASRVVFLQPGEISTKAIQEVIEWHAPGVLSLPDDLEGRLKSSYPWFRTQLVNNQEIYINDLSTIPDEAQPVRALCIENGLTPWY